MRKPPGTTNHSTHPTHPALQLSLEDDFNAVSLTEKAARALRKNNPPPQAIRDSHPLLPSLPRKKAGKEPVTPTQADLFGYGESIQSGEIAPAQTQSPEPKETIAPAATPAPPLPDSGEWYTSEQMAEYQSWLSALAGNRALLTPRFQSFPLKKLNKEVAVTDEFPRDTRRGWLIPYLLDFDRITWGRWDYWAAVRTACELGGTPGIFGPLIGLPSPLFPLQAHAPLPIPPIQYSEGKGMGGGNSQVFKMLEQCLDAIPDHGSWRGWSSSQYMDYFLDWLLFGLGYHREPVPEPLGCEGAGLRLYQLFQLNTMQLYPSDYIGDMLSESAFGKHQGFYPTPLHLCELMAQVTYNCSGNKPGPHLWETMNDPCVGTGRMLMVAGNHSLDLCAQDIMQTCVKATLVNMALYVPWGFRPFPQKQVSE